MWYAIIKWVTVEKKGLLYFTDGHYTGLSKRVFSAIFFGKKYFLFQNFMYFLFVLSFQFDVIFIETIAFI